MDDESARIRLNEILLDWTSESQFLVDKLIHELTGVGWRRKDVYELLMGAGRVGDGFSDEANDYIDDVVTSVIGHCAVESFMKFPDEPTDKDMLLEYVRGNAWKREAKG
jgi:hypothetical protein